jgi:hypothetical protein
MCVEVFMVDKSLQSIFEKIEARYNKLNKRLRLNELSFLITSEMKLNGENSRMLLRRKYRLKRRSNNFKSGGDL